MTSTDRLQIKTILIGIALIPLTVLSIYFIYGSYLFIKWPWIRFSVVLAVLTCLWTYAFWFARITGGNENSFNTLVFGLVIIPFNVLLTYPGIETLGLGSDSDMPTLLFVLEIVHGFGFYLIQKEIQKHLHNRESDFD